MAVTGQSVLLRCATLPCASPHLNSDNFASQWFFKHVQNFKGHTFDVGWTYTTAFNNLQLTAGQTYTVQQLKILDFAKVFFAQAPAYFVQGLNLE